MPLWSRVGLESGRRPGGRVRQRTRGVLDLRSRCARAHYPSVTTGSPPNGRGDTPLASPGARWTREEEDELVAAVRAGTDLSVIADRHGRTRGGIVSRLLKMIPAGEDVPEDEQLGWIMAKLADPGFDWRTPLSQPRTARRDSDASPASPASDVGQVLEIWQRINSNELTGERRARFLASPAIGDLVQFPGDVLWERGRYLYQAHGRLLLDDWAVECAVPGMTNLPHAEDLRNALARTGESVRALVAAAVAAIPDEGDRNVLERRVGLSGDGPQTLEQIGTDLGVSRERIRQRADRAVKTITSGRARAGYRTLHARARAWLYGLIRGDDEAIDQDAILAIALLSFPGVPPGNVARVIAGIVGVRPQQGRESGGNDAGSTGRVSAEEPPH